MSQLSFHSENENKIDNKVFSLININNFQDFGKTI